MKKILFTFLFYCTSILAYSQVDSLNIDSFVIVSPGKLHNNINSSNIFLDNRDTDTLDIGYIIQKKYDGNFIFNIRPGYPLKDQFTCLLDSFNTAMKVNRQLLLQLSRLKFSGSGNVNQRLLLFRANLFEISEKGYCKLRSIDTVATINAKNNKRFILNCFNSARNIIIDFISSSLSKSAVTHPEYVTLNQVKKIDSIQKAEISLYALDSLTEGVYTSYESLKDQLPDYTDFDYKMKDQMLVKVERKSTDADNMDYSFDHIYAVVVNNKIFIPENFKYHLLEKRGNDFFFRSTVKTDSGSPLGMLLISPTVFVLTNIADDIIKRNEIAYEMKLDHLDGSFIPYKMIKK